MVFLLTFRFISECRRRVLGVDADVVVIFCFSVFKKFLLFRRSLRAAKRKSLDWLKTI